MKYFNKNRQYWADLSRPKWQRYDQDTECQCSFLKHPTGKSLVRDPHIEHLSGSVCISALSHFPPPSCAFRACLSDAQYWYCVFLSLLQPFHYGLVNVSDGKCRPQPARLKVCPDYLVLQREEFIFPDDDDGLDNKVREYFLGPNCREYISDLEKKVLTAE